MMNLLRTFISITVLPIQLCVTRCCSLASQVWLRLWRRALLYQPSVGGTRKLFAPHRHFSIFDSLLLRPSFKYADCLPHTTGVHSCKISARPPKPEKPLTSSSQVLTSWIVPL